MDMTFAYLEETEAGPGITGVEVTEVAPAPKPAPQVPPPVWDARPIDPQRCMDAVHAMCG